MPAPDRSRALDHIVVVLFENRSLDNVLGHLYGPGDGKTFDGVIGKDLSNPIPAWAEHGAARQVVPYTVATDMDSPNPDSGEEYYHTNTQLYGVLDDHNRFKLGEAVTAPWNVPPPGVVPTMDGFVADYIATFTGEMGRQPTGHGDYHPAFGRSFSAEVDLKMDSPSSMLGGEAFLERVFNTYRSATSETGANVWNTALLIGWDEPGGTYDHVPPGPVPPPYPAAPAGEFGFTFDRSGYRVPAIIVSPWVEPGSVYNEEYRHTSLIATLRKAWDLGAPFTQRDASARTFDHVFTRGTPRDPQTWATVAARPLPAWAIDYQTMGQALGYLGKDVAPGIIEHARQMGVKLPPQLDDPSAELTPQLMVEVIRDVAFHYFPRLAPGDTGDSH